MIKDPRSVRSSHPTNLFTAIGENALQIFNNHSIKSLAHSLIGDIIFLQVFFLIFGTIEKNCSTCWNNVGVDFVSSLRDYDILGFRCGACYTFSMFEIVNKISLRVKETPLVAMVCSFLITRKCHT